MCVNVYSFLPDTTYYKPEHRRSFRTISPQGSASGYKPQPDILQHESVYYLKAAAALINNTDESVGSVALLQ